MKWNPHFGDPANREECNYIAHMLGIPDSDVVMGRKGHKGHRESADNKSYYMLSIGVVIIHDSKWLGTFRLASPENYQDSILLDTSIIPVSPNKAIDLNNKTIKASSVTTWQFEHLPPGFMIVGSSISLRLDTDNFNHTIKNIRRMQECDVTISVTLKSLVDHYFVSLIEELSARDCSFREVSIIDWRRGTKYEERENILRVIELYKDQPITLYNHLCDLAETNFGVPIF